jgi:endonuclease/exonuclease/phosphatase family metal-dependent hydrolase
VRKPIIGLLLLIAGGGGGWWFLQKFKIQGLDGLTIAPRDASLTGGNGAMLTAPPVQRTTDTVRIASFNIQVFGETKSSKPHVMEKLAMIVRQFDVVAIQEVRSKDNGIIPRFVDLINATGRHYDYVVGPRLGRTVSTEQYAYIFDTQSVEIDRRQLYTVDDPDDLLHREPLVGWFRVRGPNPSEAFTFTLVNIHTDPDEVKEEMNVLDDVFNAVQQDGRQEDDVIMLGDFNTDDRRMGELGKLPGAACCISGIPTNTAGTKLYDNLVYNSRATTEFTGRAGVFDFMRQLQVSLSLSEAEEISDHLPVWAEFSIYEGGAPGRVAARAGQTR